MPNPNLPPLKVLILARSRYISPCPTHLPRRIANSEPPLHLKSRLSMTVIVTVMSKPLSCVTIPLRMTPTRSKTLAPARKSLIPYPTHHLIIRLMIPLLALLHGLPIALAVPNPNCLLSTALIRHLGMILNQRRKSPQRVPKCWRHTPLLFEMDSVFELAVIVSMTRAVGKSIQMDSSMKDIVPEVHSSAPYWRQSSI